VAVVHVSAAFPPQVHNDSVGDIDLHLASLPVPGLPFLQGRRELFPGSRSDPSDIFLQLPNLLH
jgi:hypothetical protein